MKQMHRMAASARGVVLIFWVAALLAPTSNAQGPTYERTFAQSKAAVEKALKELQPSASGRLPALDGFTPPGDHPLDHFQRGYYQCATQLSAAPSGGALVRVSAKITAWYADPDPSKSGYQVLPSNGRLENDFLDRLEDALRGKTPASTANPPVSSAPSQPKNKSDPSAAAVSAPAPSSSAPAGSIATSKAPKRLPTLRSSWAIPLARTGLPRWLRRRRSADKHMEDLTKEAKGLEEILRNQAHPNNLVAVKNSGTPVLVSPVEGAKVLFLATAEDEFEILDMNANWVHVRISGLSRGWIRRSGLEMPAIFRTRSAGDNRSGSGQRP